MVTILLYLNDWQPGDGGELRVFADKATAEQATALGSSGLLKAQWGQADASSV